MNTLHKANNQTLGEEIANAVTHGVGTLLAIIGTVVLIFYAAANSNVSGIVSASVYGGSLILLYLISTLYHALTNNKAKKIFQILDHCSIFLLILGSYVPICLVLLPPQLGWQLLGINLLLTIVGITLNTISLSRWQRLSLLMYVLMGWSVAIALPYLWQMLPVEGLSLLVSGGMAYTAGIVFYADKKHKFMHSVWHLFVLAGSTLHYFFVLYYVL